jgi:hypothetical protein
MKETLQKEFTQILRLYTEHLLLTASHTAVHCPLKLSQRVLDKGRPRNSLNKIVFVTAVQWCGKITEQGIKSPEF